MSFAAEMNDFLSAFKVGSSIGEKGRERKFRERLYNARTMGMTTEQYDRYMKDKTHFGEGAETGAGTPGRTVPQTSTSAPGTTGGQGTGAPGAPGADAGGVVAVDDPSAANVLGFIRQHEAGTKDPYNTVLGGGRADLTNMTIAQVQQLQRQMIDQGKESSAVGGYQFVQNTLANTVKQLGLDPNTTKFTPEVQDKLAFQLMKNRGWGNPDITRDKLMHNLSQEWASLPSSAANKSFYEGVGSNRAGTTWDQFSQSFSVPTTPTTKLAGPQAPTTAIPTPPTPVPSTAPISAAPAAAAPAAYSDAGDEAYVDQGDDTTDDEEPGYQEGGTVQDPNFGAPRAFTQAVAADPARPAMNNWRPRMIGDPSNIPTVPNPSAGIQQRFRDLIAAQHARNTAANAQGVPGVPTSPPAGRVAFDRTGMMFTPMSGVMGKQGMVPPGMDTTGWTMANGAVYDKTGNMVGTLQDAAMQRLNAMRAQNAQGQGYQSSRSGGGTGNYGVGGTGGLYAEGGLVEDDQRQAIPTGQLVSPRDYGRLDPGGGPIRDSTAALWRLDAQAQKQSAKRLAERDQSYQQMKPVPTPVPRPKDIDGKVPTPPPRPKGIDKERQTQVAGGDVRTEDAYDPQAQVAGGDTRLGSAGQRSSVIGGVHRSSVGAPAQAIPTAAPPTYQTPTTGTYPPMAGADLAAANSQNPVNLAPGQSPPAPPAPPAPPGIGPDIAAAQSGQGAPPYDVPGQPTLPATPLPAGQQPAPSQPPALDQPMLPLNDPMRARPPAPPPPGAPPYVAQAIPAGPATPAVQPPIQARPAAPGVTGPATPPDYPRTPTPPSMVSQQPRPPTPPEPIRPIPQPTYTLPPRGPELAAARAAREHPDVRGARGHVAQAIPTGTAARGQQPPIPAGTKSDFMAQANPRGLVSAGNIDLRHRPLVKNEDGSTSTVRSMSYGDDNGNEVLIPTVSDEGKILSPREAVRYWKSKGQNLGVFRTAEDADAYAEALHNQQADFYGLDEAAEPGMPPRSRTPGSSAPPYRGPGKGIVKFAAGGVMPDEEDQQDQMPAQALPVLPEGRKAAATSDLEQTPQGAPQQRYATSGGKPLVSRDEAKQSTAAGMKYINDNILSAQPTRAIGNDPAQGDAQQKFDTNDHALTSQEVAQITQQVDPENKLSQSQKILKAQQDMFDWYTKEGMPQKAAAAAASMLMYGRRVSQMSGTMATAALQSGRPDALDQAARFMAKAYETLPDGKSLRADPAQNGVVHYQIVDDSTGKVEDEGDADAQQMGQMAQSMMTGGEWQRQALSVAQGYSLTAGGTTGKIPYAQQRYAERTKYSQAVADAVENLKKNPNDPAAKEAYEQARNAANAHGVSPGALKIYEQQVNPKVAVTTPKTAGERATAEADEALKTKLGDLDQKIQQAPDDATRKSLTQEKVFTTLDDGYDRVSKANKRRVDSKGLEDRFMTMENPPSPEDQAFLKDAVPQMMRANPYDAGHNVDILMEALDPAQPLSLVGNKVRIGGDLFPMSSSLFKQLITRRNQRKQSAAQPQQTAEAA